MLCAIPALHERRHQSRWRTGAMAGRQRHVFAGGIERELVVVRIAERAGSAAAAPPRPARARMLRTGARRAPRGQEDRRVGERERIAGCPRSRDHAARERFGKGCARRDGEDIRGHEFRPVPRSARNASASFTASGVPT
jgi:hypothetical protein